MMHFAVVLASTMLKIEVESNGAGHLIRVIGRVRREHLDELAAQIGKTAVKPILDLREVTLVDLDVVRFLLKQEQDGIMLENCPPFIREWIVREAAGAPQQDA